MVPSGGGGAESQPFVATNGNSVLMLPDLIPSSTTDAGVAISLQSVTNAASSAQQKLSITDLGGPSRWIAWLGQLHALDAQTTIDCGPTLWRFIAILVNGLAEETSVMGDLLRAVAASALRCILFLTPPCPGGSGATAGMQELAAGLMDVLALAGEKLQQALACGGPTSFLIEGFAACAKTMIRVPSARNAVAVRAAENWLRASLANGVPLQGLGAECLSLARAAEATGAGNLLNIAWRLLKVLCLDSTCDMPMTCTVLEHAARAAAEQLVAARDGEHVGGDPLFVAKFHCSNFLRLARDSPALMRECFPIRQVLEAFAPAASALGGRPSEALDTGTEQPIVSMARELLHKLMGLAVERWATAANGQPDVEKLEQFLATPALADALVRCSLPFLASGRVDWSAIGGPDALIVSTETIKAESLLTFVLKFIEVGPSDGFRGSLRLGASEVNALAMLFAAGAPGVRQRVLVWTFSSEPPLYCLALRLHQLFPLWLGAGRSLAWAQMLVQGAICARDGPPSRSQCQAASCAALVVARCPPAKATVWVQAALAPLIAAGPGDPTPPVALWVLARRLAASLGSGDTPVVGILAALVNRRLEVGSGVDARGTQLEGRAIRCFGVLTRKGALRNDVARLTLTGECLRRILGSASIPLKLRIDVWAAHTEVCIQLKAKDEFRVSMRYAIKHLSGLERAGVHVAAALVRAPNSMLDGVQTTLDGLCRMTWPLRCGGLGAAAAISSRNGAVPAALVTTASHACDAFADDTCGRSGTNSANSGIARATGTWPMGPNGLRAKRRRLLAELARLPEDAAEDPELPALCSAAAARIATWSHSLPRQQCN